MSIQCVTLKHQQNGAVLVVGLILLAVLVLIGITAVNFTSLSEKLTGNQRNQEIALQAAESALIDAELWLKNLTNVPVAISTCSTPPCDVYTLGTFTDLNLKDHSWWMANGSLFSAHLDEVYTQPVYLIEEHSFIPYELDPDARSKGEGYYYYKITARGTGGNDTTARVVQSVYTIQYK